MSDEDEKMDSLLQTFGWLPDENDKKQQSRRSEASEDVSQFSLIDKKDGNVIEVEKLLAGSEGKAGKLKTVRNQIKRSMKMNLLSAPLSKAASDGVQRVVEYKKMIEASSKWEKVVQDNRKADHLSFPLGHQSLSISTVSPASYDNQKNKQKSKLEEEISELLLGNKCVEKTPEGLSVAEQQALNQSKMSLAEARELHAQLRKHRAFVSYQQSKMKRQGKIKSKKYRRNQRLIESKKKKQEGIEEDVDVEKTRAEERASLRHSSNGSKWKKNRRVIAKHDAATREKINEQMARHQQLTSKIAEVSSSEDEIEPEPKESTSTVLPPDQINPWFSLSNNNPPEETLKPSSDEKFREALDDIEKEVEIKDDVLVDKESKEEIRTISKFEKTSNMNADTMTIVEAFADDDIVAEFVATKKKIESEDNKISTELEEIQMPGWGSWAGCGLEPSSKKRKRKTKFTNLEKTGLPKGRKDRKLNHVIINEASRNSFTAKHQVNNLPFPYTSKEQFERTLAAPIGSTWNPPSVFKDNIRPKVSTVIGTYINPMNPESSKKSETFL